MYKCPKFWNSYIFFIYLCVSHLLVFITLHSSSENIHHKSVLLYLSYFVHIIWYLFCDRQDIELNFINRVFCCWLVCINWRSKAAIEYLLVRTMFHVRNCLPFPCGWFFNCLVQKGNEIWSPSHSDKPKISSFPCMSFVFVINIQNHKSEESDCWEYLHVLISEISWFV